MIRSLTIDGYRGFPKFEMSEFGTINLLIGRNNTGKTSILEALYLLAREGDPYAIWRILSRRGESFDPDTRRAFNGLEYEISQLFNQGVATDGSRFSFTISNGEPDQTLEFRLAEPSFDEPAEMSDEAIASSASGAGRRLNLLISGEPKPASTIMPLTRRGGISLEMVDRTRRIRGPGTSPGEGRPAQLVTTESLTVQELLAMWNEIALTEGEDLVLSALRFLDPEIERIAVMNVANFSTSTSRGGFKVKMSNRSAPFPIGSLGDCAWRMLALAIALVRSANGVLLVDEIDTGLHYTVMSDMWKFMYKIAKTFNVQIFATTHSFDCIQSLAVLCGKENLSDKQVTVQRIEKGKQNSVMFSAEDIRTAAQMNIELR